MQRWPWVTVMPVPLGPLIVKVKAPLVLLATTHFLSMAGTMTLMLAVSAPVSSRMSWDPSAPVRVTTTPPATLFDNRGLRRASTQERQTKKKDKKEATHTTWERGQRPGVKPVGL